ncbi:MAG TPA: hypothetical protein VGS41_18945, partial [Chthonomonadales bacterium]|nr:hypothetical protein [Chthonomonadales bacterium]
MNGGKVARALSNPSIVARYVRWKLLLAAISVHNGFVRKKPPCGSACLRELAEIEERRLRDTDISDHLPALFAEALSVQPGLILELGVRGGDSTFVLERVARLCGCALLSVDIADCSDVCGWS